MGKVEFSILRGNAQVTVIADKPEATTRLGVTMKDPMASYPHNKNAKVRAGTEHIY